MHRPGHAPWLASLLGCCTVQHLTCMPRFHRNISPQPAKVGSKTKEDHRDVWVISLMMEVVRTSETSVSINFTRRYIPEDSKLHTRRRENLISHKRKVLPPAPCKRQGVENLYLLLHILDLGITLGEWSASRSGRALPQGKGPPVPIG
jgi:hypothetical protein